ncbi:putative TspO/MBR-related protein precursor [Actinoplanes sp. NBRC 14428]|uniref:TspO/MBR related protein n=1 Tax=Pseudosporangium ferrugineum TaxID=439699 RepID=A0A2T0RQ33_9ACTN|nr:TspO/MBR family protein [Pseudosporangium ferrugineum]PRY23304.1 TspO/MBR related protein [Pseudosporangium ferrugineum]BCJ55285.1 putative TspO/MBR-related protein precursor [Actinoplanes sp. NBRC 14428]
MTSHVAYRPRRSPGSRWGLVPFAAAVTLAAAIGGLGVAGTSAEYQGLDQPPWAPPSWLFGPVWTLLYATIAVAGWLAWRRSGWTPALTAYAIQLVLNALWTPIFFGFGEYGLALIDIVLMWLAIGATVLLFRPISRLAAGLLLPYWAWVTFATALNTAIWLAN